MRLFSKVQLQKAAKLRSEGLTFPEIGERLRLDYKVVYRRLRQLKLYTPPEYTPVEPPQISDVEAAYVAGLFDGEGTVGWYAASHGKAAELRIVLGQVDEDGGEVVEWLRDTFGGGMRVSVPKAVRCRPQRIWTATGETAFVCLKALLPYLRVKRHNAELAVSLYEQKTGGLSGEYILKEWAANYHTGSGGHRGKIKRLKALRSHSFNH